MQVSARLLHHADRPKLEHLSRRLTELVRLSSSRAIDPSIARQTYEAMELLGVRSPNLHLWVLQKPPTSSCCQFTVEMARFPEVFFCREIFSVVQRLLPSEVIRMLGIAYRMRQNIQNSVVNESPFTCVGGSQGESVGSAVLPFAADREDHIEEVVAQCAKRITELRTALSARELAASLTRFESLGFFGKCTRQELLNNLLRRFWCVIDDSSSGCLRDILLTFTTHFSRLPKESVPDILEAVAQRAVDCLGEALTTQENVSQSFEGSKRHVQSHKERQKVLSNTLEIISLCHSFGWEHNGLNNAVRYFVETEPPETGEHITALVDEKDNKNDQWKKWCSLLLPQQRKLLELLMQLPGA